MERQDATDATFPLLAAAGNAVLKMGGADVGRNREEMRRKLDLCPQVLRFRGLRVCVKQLTGSKRWTRRCQVLHDQIVDYLRTCLGAEKGAAACALVVS